MPGATRVTTALIQAYTIMSQAEIMDNFARRLLREAKAHGAGDLCAPVNDIQSGDIYLMLIDHDCDPNHPDYMGPIQEE